MSNQHEGQWDDERIESALLWVKHRGLTAGTRIMLRQMRDDLQAQIDALRQELAARQWTPVPDGDIHSFLAVQDNGETIAVFVNDDYGYAEEALPDDIRLCRLTPASLQAAVGVAAQEEANDATE